MNASYSFGMLLGTLLLACLAFYGGRYIFTVDKADRKGWKTAIASVSFLWGCAGVVYNALQLLIAVA